jgi:hypothetical protein
MKTAFTWLIFLTLLAVCVAIQWLPDPLEHAPRTFDKVLVFKSLAWTVMVFGIMWMLVWIPMASWRVKKAIAKAQEPDYEGIRNSLHPTASPLYPSPRYNDIVLLLEQLYTTPSAKPEVKASDFSQYFTTRGQGYFLTLEGKEKMLDRINSGFLSAKFMDNYEPKDIVKICCKLVVVVVLIRFGIFIIGAIADWFSGH